MIQNRISIIVHVCMDLSNHYERCNNVVTQKKNIRSSIATAKSYETQVGYF